MRAIAALTLLALASLSVADSKSFRLASGYLSVEGKGTCITSLRADPSGRGNYGRNWTIELGFDGVRATDRSRLIITGRRVHVTNVLAYREHTIRTHHTYVPYELRPGHTLGQTFRIPEGAEYTSLEIHIPTWHTRSSDATLRLRRGGPGGEVIAHRRLQNVRDNSWLGLEFEPLPPGVYYLEMAEPSGHIGWWGARRRSYRDGQAYIDGKPIDTEFALRVHGRTPIATGSVVYELRGDKLTATARLRPYEGVWLPRYSLRWLLRWYNLGYDVSARSVPFWRFFSDDFRYMPTHQLKRWRERDGWYELHFHGNRWIECDGTENADVRFLGSDLGLRWHLRDTRAGLYVSVPRGSDRRSYTLTIQVLPRDDTLPAEWPRFRLPSSRDSQEANTFYYERAFTYRPIWGPAAWFEWNALGRLWHFSRHIDTFRGFLETYTISDEGYVHTWGRNPGWPFPDNTKYDTRHFDTNARFILACWRYAAWTRDADFLKRQAQRIRKAMNYQLTVLKGTTGLIYTASKDVTGRHMGVGDNYWDILPFGHLDAYANIVFYASLEAMAQIEEMLAEAGGQKTQAPARSPQFYRKLAQKARRAFNETFWNERKGRYIGCIDIDGKKHDYGFTFLNLEAMAYGLADPDQVRRIYHWMETEPTSSGKPDTYTRWIFAPRATTIHNPRWSPEKGKLEDVPQEPWWHFGWHGTPFGDQCQDGGAILYTSFYDLMARTRFLGPDNALERWRKIMWRWRLPDHLCGGPRLYFGEFPQQIQPAQVGVDMPFPESSLVPCWLIYGVMGIQATSRGLEIAPRLPNAWPSVAVENLQYRGLPLTVEVTRDEVTIRCDAPGYEFTWRKKLSPDGKVIFTSPPAPVKWPPEPLWRAQTTGPWQARWIWVMDAEAPQAFFRYDFDLPAAPAKAWLSITADNAFVLYINGQRVGSGNEWTRLFSFDIVRYLKAGRNVMAVEVTNSGGPGGLVAQGKVVLPDGTKRTLVTDGHWRCSEKPTDGWQRPDFDDAAWAPASPLGRPPCGPWGDIGQPKPPR